MDEVTHEVYHSSILEQAELAPAIREIIENKPELVAELLPWEEKVKASWDGKLTATLASEPQKLAEENADKPNLLETIFDLIQTF